MSKHGHEAKRLLRTAVVMGALVMAGSVGAQEADQDADPPEGLEAGGETAGGQAEPQVSETHVVANGETLWDLCTKYLNSPWYWPKIWSYNPQITNPHWIFPGNELRFYPSDESLPTAVAVSRDLNAPKEASDDDFVIPGQLDIEDLVRPVSPLSVGGVAKDSVFSNYRGFVSAEQQQVAGQITNSPIEAQMITDYDRVYIKLKSAAKKGQNFAVYRTIKSLDHPFTGESIGFAIEIVGSVTIVDTSPQVATGLITAAYRGIERGDFVGPFPESAQRRVQPVANEADVKAYIVETLESALSEVGEHHVVFLDKGRDEGVKLGNTFTVFGRGDRFTRELSGLPNEELGRLLIIDVQQHSATAMVVRSVREMSVGDKAEMRKAI